MGGWGLEKILAPGGWWRAYFKISFSVSLNEVKDHKLAVRICSSPPCWLPQSSTGQDSPSCGGFFSLPLIPIQNVHRLPLTISIHASGSSTLAYWRNPWPLSPATDYQKCQLRQKWRWVIHFWNIFQDDLQENRFWLIKKKIIISMLAFFPGKSQTGFKIAIL